ncbi:hypothetical protein CCO04_01160 [Pimelobacter sp. 30-1]|nr:hypothetical protein [Pimelobacter sp. 30-1]
MVDRSARPAALALVRTYLATAVAAAALLVAGTAPAQAYTTYTPRGGPVTFVGTSISFTDIDAAQTFTCPTFNMSGSVINSGTSRSYGADAVTLGTLTSGGCSNPLSGPSTLNPSGTWTFAITGDATGGAWPARLKNVRLRMQAATCVFWITGVVNGQFNQSSGGFTPNTGPSGLKVAGGPDAPTGSMCLTLDIVADDNIGVGGYWQVSGLTITNP